MRNRIVGLLLLLSLSVISSPVSAGSAAVGAVSVSRIGSFEGVFQYTVTWTSSAGGAVSANAFSIEAGHIQSVKFVPDGGGTQPSNLYDATLVDDDGIDILNGQAANLSNSSGVYFQFNPPFYFPGRRASKTLDLVIANAGNAKKGTVTLWVK